ncbi:tagatose-6-phosphate kinase [Lacticaseibacillus pantheris DSM 15945 = JCM 12539 = NBRC 106106]|uniref:Tagatose-6-phosphate kinase n=1 Tax=Lacticaseibacillus pantheris DSM 15945 = JCM 12539 = NBRC 106106 TaxID=1423783 RepID=A0A0R1U7W0_9LACO|nr:1-phosphofructokinase family hexose kinase [Lacticaseibacillus pantheris]KRL85931.1 tagatose-6-phosphate kinase [Lacticaseibacillus pantheris DSM 15945 = JCM 12539 = NBRC 106106]
MILTITANPSIDMIYHTLSFDAGKTNRETSHKQVVGGKGINAARVASILSGQNNNNVVATGFVGEQNGQLILDDLANYEVTHKFIARPGRTRLCYTIIDQNGTKTELNENGDPVSEDQLQELLNMIRSLDELDAVSINGSLPPNSPIDAYSQIIQTIREISPNSKIILDTSGQALRDTISGNFIPDIIKPNNDELGELTGEHISENPRDAIAALHNQRLARIPIVVVSLGSTGAAIKVGTANPQFYVVKTRSLNAVNTEGAGDSTVGGMLFAISQGLGDLRTVKYGMAAGMANVMELKTGFLQPENVSAYIEDDSQILFQKIN